MEVIQLSQENKDLIIERDIWKNNKKIPENWIGKEIEFIEKLDNLEKQSIINKKDKKDIILKTLKYRYLFWFHPNVNSVLIDTINSNSNCIVDANLYYYANTVLHLILKKLKEKMNTFNKENTDLFEYFIYIIERKINYKHDINCINFTFKLFKDLKELSNKLFIIEQYYLDNFNTNHTQL